MIKFEEGEEIKKVVRRHWLVMVPVLLTSMVLALAPLILVMFIMSDLLPLDPVIRDLVENFWQRWKAFGYSIWLLLLWIFLFIEWTDYYLDLWLITDRRIIDVEQKGFFNREVISLSYRQIQDITVETRGIVQTLLKFGTLHIQTAGHDREIIIHDAHYPEDVRFLILGLTKTFHERSGGQGGGMQ